MTLTLLIDADVYLYRACWAVQKNIDWGEGQATEHADWFQTKTRFDSELADVRATLRAGRLILCLSDIRRNWRKELYPAYKANRTQRKPSLFYKLREYVEHNFDARWEPGLEGDDILGLYATGTSIPDPKVIVSIDKDMQSVPCRLYNPNHPEFGVRTVSEIEADEFHLMQTLMGDPVDGYHGVPGIGPKKAAALLFNVPIPERWGVIVRSYARAGLNESHALLNARVARILRAGEFDKETQRVALWNPQLPPPSPAPSPAPSKGVTSPASKRSRKSRTPGSAKSSRPAPAGTRKKGKGARTSSPGSSSSASGSTSRTGPASTGTTTGRKASPSPGTGGPRSGTS